MVETRATFCKVDLSRVELSVIRIAVTESTCNKIHRKSRRLKVGNQMLFKIKVDYVQPSFGVRKIKKKIVKKRLQNVSMTL